MRPTLFNLECLVPTHNLTSGKVYRGVPVRKVTTKIVSTKHISVSWRISNLSNATAFKVRDNSGRRRIFSKDKFIA